MFEKFNDFVHNKMEERSQKKQEKFEENIGEVRDLYSYIRSAQAKHLEFLDYTDDERSGILDKMLIRHNDALEFLSTQGEFGPVDSRKRYLESELAYVESEIATEQALNQYVEGFEQATGYDFDSDSSNNNAVTTEESAENPKIKSNVVYLSNRVGQVSESLIDDSNDGASITVLKPQKVPVKNTTEIPFIRQILLDRHGRSKNREKISFNMELEEFIGACREYQSVYTRMLDQRQVTGNERIERLGNIWGGMVDMIKSAEDKKSSLHLLFAKRKYVQETKKLLRQMG